MIRHSTISVIESDRARIAHLERRLVERENTVSMQADQLAYMGLKCAALREELRQKTTTIVFTSKRDGA